MALLRLLGIKLTTTRVVMMPLSWTEVGRCLGGVDSVTVGDRRRLEGC